MLKEPPKQLTSGGGCATIEAKSEFVKVIIEMLLTDGTLMRAQQPALQQRYHPMHAGKEMLPLSVATLQSLVVNIVYQPKVRLESVRSDGATWFNRVGNEAVQTFLGQVRNVPQPNAADTLSTCLNSNDDYRLVIRKKGTFVQSVLDIDKGGE